jgi:hypothetical protein
MIKALTELFTKN